MAGELIISPVPYLTGANIYFQVFDASGQIWDTGDSAFEAYATASIGDYDIAATELGTASGIYQASMPAAAKGIVSALARRRVGASPAETDPVVGVMAPRAWTGSAFVDVGDIAKSVLDEISATGTVDDESATTTEFDGDSSLSDQDGWYENATIVFTSGDLADLVRKVEGYTGATRTFTFEDPWPTAPGDGDTFRIIGRIE